MHGPLLKISELFYTMFFVVLVIAGGGASLLHASPLRPPQRIVSLNLCTDQLLMMLVEPSRIAAVTFLARQTTISVMAATAKRLPITWGKAEEVFLLKPDLVLAGSYTPRLTLDLLRKLNNNIVVMPPASNFAEIFRNIEIVGKAVGESDRAKNLIARLKRQLAQQLSKVAASSRGQAPLAALYFANGYSSGKNTLTDSVVRDAGFKTLGQKMAFGGMRKISLEALILARPDALVLEHKSYEGEALAYEIFKHPVLRHLTSQTSTLSISNALSVCGTPQTIKALQRLQDFRNRHFANRAAKEKDEQ